MTFGEKLTATRKEKNLSQEDLAQKLYVTRQAISRWENNSAQPSFEMLSVICRELDKTPNDFIETERENRLRFYKSLSFSEKYVLALEWRSKNKLTYFLIWVYDMIFNLGIGLTVFFAVSQLFHNYSPLLRAFSITGAVLFAVAGILLLVITLINNSIKYNVWLLQTKSIIRKRK